MPQCMAMLLTGQARSLIRRNSNSFQLLALRLLVCRLPQQHHFVNEPVLYRRFRPGIVVEEAGGVEVHAAVRRHRAVLRLERHVAAGMDTDAPVVDGVTEQQGRQRYFALGQQARPGMHIRGDFLSNAIARIIDECP